mgnify:CR=1 FL=1
MMKKHIVKELISEMKDRIPQGHNLANYLTDTLCMGKEAVYRRLRGEVAFTFDEIAVISCSLGISIDQIIGNHLANRVTFDLNLQHSSDLMDSYYEIVGRYLQIFHFTKGHESTELYSASNAIPFTLYSPYEYLSRFRLCRWIYQNGKIKTPHSLGEMQVPEKIITAHKKLSDSIKKLGKIYFIWDANIFSSFVKEIKYFAGLNLISAADISYLKKELQQVLNDLEEISIKGSFKEGNEVAIYLSNIDFETTYGYVSRKDFQISLFRVYSINYMDSQSPHICQMQKNWIQSLRRHSTLISGSGETDRIAFLEKQREIIESL